MVPLRRIWFDNRKRHLVFDRSLLKDPSDTKHLLSSSHDESYNLCNINKRREASPPSVDLDLSIRPICIGLKNDWEIIINAMIIDGSISLYPGSCVFISAVIFTLYALKNRPLSLLLSYLISIQTELSVRLNRINMDCPCRTVVFTETAPCTCVHIDPRFSARLIIADCLCRTKILAVHTADTGRLIDAVHDV